jgi:hypothetical protein
MKNTIAVFQASTDEDLRWRITLLGTDFAARTLVVYVRERGSNLQKLKLELGSGLTRTVEADRVHIDARVARAAMASWAKTEYETDITDETTGATRIVPVRVVYDEPGKLPGGISGNQATVALVNNQAVVTAIGGVGLPGPSTNIEIGDVDTLETGEPATAAITGTAPDLVLNLGLPKGNTGNQGPAGQIVSVGAVGLPAGAEPGVVNDGTPEQAELVFGIPRGDQGDKGWSPLFAMVPDGARRVLQVQSWTGGEGAPPAAGGYLGPSGIVATAAEATDFRGEPGAAVGPGSIGTDELAPEAVTEEKIDADFVATLATQDDLQGLVPRTSITGSAVLPAGTTAQRDEDPFAGRVRFNTTTGEYEGGNGTEWVPLGGGGAIPGDAFPTENLRDGMIFWHKTWLAMFVYHVDANGGHWVSAYPIIDPSAFVLKGTAQSDLGFSAFMWGLRQAASAALARETLAIPWELIEQKSPTLGQTEIDFTSFPAGFDRFVLQVDNIGVVTDDTSVILRVQTGGSTWQTTGYLFGGFIGGPGGTLDLGSTVDSYTGGIPLNKIGTGNAVGNAAGKSLSARIEFNAKSTSGNRRFRIHSDYSRNDGFDVGAVVNGSWPFTTAITGVRLFSGSPQFKGQGNVKLLGLRA